MRVNDSSFWQYTAYADIRGRSPEKGRQTTVRCRQRQFSAFSLAIFRKL